jgi:hypothetical protein
MLHLQRRQVNARQQLVIAFQMATTTHATKIMAQVLQSVEARMGRC